MASRFAVVVSHPIQHFAPWHRELARRSDVDLHVMFCCDWGVEEYTDPEFGASFKWDVPLLEGYSHEFLPIAKRPQTLGFRSIDNPGVNEALDRFQPDVLQVFGYVYRTNWRAVAWARRRRVPVLLYSDSNIRRAVPWYKRAVKDTVVRSFYRRVDGALYVGDSNREYHAHYGVPEERLLPSALPVDRRRLLDAVPDREKARRQVRERHGIPADAFVAILSGKYIPRKRPLDLVQAVGSAARSGLPIWAMLVGEGPERQAIERHCREQGIRNVVLTGLVNQSEMPTYYAAADVLVVTSAQDPHPLAVTEGACFGLPALVSDAIGCIGPNDTARPGANALVYPCGDCERLEKELRWLFDAPDLRERLSAASEKIAESQDVVVAAAELAAAVERIRQLGPRRRGRARG